MDSNQYKKSPIGKIIATTDNYEAFVPNPLSREINISNKIQGLLSEADWELGKLAGIGAQLPNPNILIRPFARKEAVLSSKIEGTESSLSDLLYFEARGRIEHHPEDVPIVANYVKAMSNGLERLKTLPLSLRLVREIHSDLMHGMRKEDFSPGEFRISQNWIGPRGCSLMEATYVPPPVNEMKKGLYDLELFWNEDLHIPILIQVALTHYQFEAIHPFRDGNGRIGRLLMTFYLCVKNRLPIPLLYLSAYFERHREEYYNHLLQLGQIGDWDSWFEFFLTGVIQQSKDAIKRADRLLTLIEEYQEKVQRPRLSALVPKLIDNILMYPVLTVPKVKQILGVTYPAARKAIGSLENIGVLLDMEYSSRPAVWVAHEVIDAIEKE